MFLHLAGGLFSHCFEFLVGAFLKFMVVVVVIILPVKGMVAIWISSEVGFPRVQVSG